MCTWGEVATPDERPLCITRWNEGKSSSEYTCSPLHIVFLSLVHVVRVQVLDELRLPLPPLAAAALRSSITTPSFACHCNSRRRGDRAGARVCITTTRIERRVRCSDCSVILQSARRYNVAALQVSVSNMYPMEYNSGIHLSISGVATPG